MAATSMARTSSVGPPRQHAVQGGPHPVVPGLRGVVGQLAGVGRRAGAWGTRRDATTRPSPSAAIALTEVVPMSMPTVTSVAISSPTIDGPPTSGRRS